MNTLVGSFAQTDRRLLATPGLVALAACRGVFRELALAALATALVDAIRDSTLVLFAVIALASAFVRVTALDLL